MIVNWLGLLIVAFLPPAVYAIWIRNTERHGREPWKPVFICFAWGATIAVVSSFVLEVILHIPLSRSLRGHTVHSLIGAVAIAPVVEEFMKPLVLGLRSVRRECNEIEDGFIYGAAAGLGFSATENLLYEWSFVSQGALTFFFLVVVRSIACCLIHASATALTGYGYAKSIIQGKKVSTTVPFLMLAMGVHALYNFVVSFAVVGGIVCVAAGTLMAVLSIRFIRKRIRVFDEIDPKSSRV